jgi:Zn-dependent protease with chaperone function
VTSLETFDFQKYISEHRDPNAKRKSLPVGEYAFRGDVQALRALHGLAPVRLVLGAALRFWQSFGRKRLLDQAVRASEHEAPRVHDQAMHAARSLKMNPQIVYMAPAMTGSQVARALGTQDETLVAVQPMMVPAMDDLALRFFIGRELGHIQNGHTMYHTAAFYADALASTPVRWALSLAVISLNHWRQRSELTADRAGLLCCRDPKVAVQQIARHALAEQRVESDVDVQTVLESLDQSNEGLRSALWRRFSDRLPTLRLRVRALEVFAKSQYFQDAIGQSTAQSLTLSEVDDEVEEMLRGHFRS